MQALFEKYRDQGLQVIGINTGERERDPIPKAREFRDKHKLTFPVLYDSAGVTHTIYGYGTALPKNALVDRDGILRQVWLGFGQAVIEAEIVKYLRQPPAKPRE